MNLSSPNNCIAFNGMRRVAVGSLAEVAIKLKPVIDSPRHGPILIFDAVSSELLEIDTRGSLDEVAQRYALPVDSVPAISFSANSVPAMRSAVDESPAHGDRESINDPSQALRGRGRPRLGVVAREVTLLPRHWEWLNTQPGGASVALRKLVEAARRINTGRDHARKSREAAYKFMSPIASGLDSFEEAVRALFAINRQQFEAILADWPTDVREHALVLARDSFAVA